MIAKQVLARISPVQAAFFGSLLLSLVALLTNPVINRDGILYVETARLFLQDGFAAAHQSFSWPFLPIVMAIVSKLTGIGLEKTGHILNALFMAGACALVVASATRRTPEAAWSICLVVLALPGLNHYREELLREYGCWFFVTLSFWLALRWSEHPRWTSALAAQASLGVAALFRPEAAIFFLAFIAWQLFAAPAGEKWRRALMIGGLPLLGLATLAALIASGQLESAPRLAHELGRINSARFDAKAQALAAALAPYARDQAGSILFLGSLALIPLKFIRQLGPFIIPLLFILSSNSHRSLLSRAPLFAWALLAHLFVLSAFVVDMQFLAGRYVSVLSLLAAPFIGVGLWQLIQHYPRWQKAVLLVACLIAVNNAVTFGPSQTQFIGAGAWLASNAGQGARVYIESSRTAYYAGWEHGRVSAAEDRPRLNEAALRQKFDLFVFEVSHRDADIEPWLRSNNLVAAKRFSNSRHDSIVIAGHRSSP